MYSRGKVLHVRDSKHVVDFKEEKLSTFSPLTTMDDLDSIKM